MIFVASNPTASNYQATAARYTYVKILTQIKLEQAVTFTLNPAHNHKKI